MKNIILKCLIMAYIISISGNFVAEAMTLSYAPVSPCRIADTRKSGGIIDTNTQRNFHVYGDGATISAQGGDASGCPTPMGEPLAAHIKMVAVSPSGKGNMQAYQVGDTPGANFGVNFANIGTNFANTGTVETSLGVGPDITVTSRYSSTHAVVDVLGYYYPDGDFTYIHPRNTMSNCGYPENFSRYDWRKYRKGFSCLWQWSNY